MSFLLRFSIIFALLKGNSNSESSKLNGNGEVMLNNNRYQKLDLTSLGISDDEFRDVVEFFKCLKKIRDEQAVLH